MTDIDPVGSTAFVAAATRAMESERDDPLFEDPHAALFASDQARAASVQMHRVFPPGFHMIRYRTLCFNLITERFIGGGVRQVVLLGGGLDMRAHKYRNPDVDFFEVDQKGMIDFKRAVLAKVGIQQAPSLGVNYLEADVVAGLAEVGFDPHASTLMVWEANTMYLPPESIMPFLNRLAEGASRFSIAFDYFAHDLQRRDLADPDDVEKLAGMERAMNTRFHTGFPDLGPFEAEAPYKVTQSSSFAELALTTGAGGELGEALATWRRTLELYRYCVLTRR